MQEREIAAQMEIAAQLLCVVRTMKDVAAGESKERTKDVDARKFNVGTGKKAVGDASGGGKM